MEPCPKCGRERCLGDRLPYCMGIYIERIEAENAVLRATLEEAGGWLDNLNDALVRLDAACAAAAEYQEAWQDAKAESEELGHAEQYPWLNE